MMYPGDIRMECLRLAATGAAVAARRGEGTLAPVSSLDAAATAAIIDRARAYAEFVLDLPSPRERGGE